MIPRPQTPSLSALQHDEYPLLGLDLLGELADVVLLGFRVQGSGFRLNYQI